jgi:hypothetical protein
MCSFEGRGLYKSIHTYAEMLEQAGFKVHQVLTLLFYFIELNFCLNYNDT